MEHAMGFRFVMVLSCGFLASCGGLAPLAKPAPVGPPTEKTHPPQFTIHREIYDQLSAKESRIEISRSQQRLLLKDKQGRIALETDCSTGITGKETPLGKFTILERIVDKRSNLYGKYVDKKTGEVVVAKSWTVAKAPAGTKYLGTAMPYWMRVTWDGVGIHVGKFPRGYRSSFGCVRMPEEIQPYVYKKCRVGTPVKIHEEVTAE